MNRDIIEPHRYRWTPGQRILLLSDILEAPIVEVGEWQSMDVGSSPLHKTHEMEDVIIIVENMPSDIPTLQDTIMPDLPWAEDHFLERVSGIPHNPPPSHVDWPYAVRGNDDHRRIHDTNSAEAKFDHTYPERFWPKHAYGNSWPKDEIDSSFPMRGIRFAYGDLNDVVELLVRNPMTRQAYLPVWFPEDTGATEQQRVPCTLGYHFMIRNNQLTTRYYIRSCDVYRHLTNDIYFACRLTQWMVTEFNIKRQIRHRAPTAPVRPNGLIMHITSLHAFVGDRPKITRRIRDYSTLT